MARGTDEVQEAFKALQAGTGDFQAVKAAVRAAEFDRAPLGAPGSWDVPRPSVHTFEGGVTPWLLRQVITREEFDLLSAIWRGRDPEGQTQDPEGWVIHAVVDTLDPNTVMFLVRMRPSGAGTEIESWVWEEWVEDRRLAARILSEHPPPLVKLTDAQIVSIKKQAREVERAERERERRWGRGR